LSSTGGALYTRLCICIPPSPCLTQLMRRVVLCASTIPSAATIRTDTATAVLALCTKLAARGCGNGGRRRRLHE
jgi:hypothetical protein